MAEIIAYCIITVFLIAAFFFAWYFYQQARNKERLVLIEKGENPDEIFKKQKQDGFRFIFPWLKLANVILGLSIGFGVISIYFMQRHENDVFQGFFITFIIGISLGIPMLINHFIGNKKKE